MHKKNKLTNNKGEMTTQQIVLLIILIVSFAVILFLIFRLNFKENTDKEICHNSVVMSDKTSSLVGGLDCKTNYLCISSGKNCEDFNPTTTIKIKQKNKEEIIKIISEEMADCWWMFGEGKLNYGGSDLSGGTICALCSVVAFDGESKNVFEEMSYRDFYGNLSAMKKTNSQTYLQYLYGVSNLQSFENNFPIQGYLNNKIEFDKQYFILTGKSKSGLWDKWPFGKEGDIPSIILEKTPESYEKIKCDDFVTKA